MPEIETPRAELVGGPAGEASPTHGEPHPDLKTQTPALKHLDPPQTKYELNGKTFGSASEMSQYVADLEKKVLTQPTTVQQPIYQTTKPSVELIDGKPIDEMLFENPSKVLNHFRQQVREEVNQLATTENNRKTFWEGFYKENPDLNGKQDLVDAFVAKNWSQWQNLKVEEFSKAVSGQTRSALKKMGLDKAVEVPNNNAAALSGSGNGAPAQAQGERKDTTFIDELNAKRMKKKIK